MSKQLTAEELQQVKDLKQDYNTLAFTLGEIELQKANLNDEHHRLLELRKNIYEKEQTLVKQLREKYGDGSINLETGVID